MNRILHIFASAFLMVSFTNCSEFQANQLASTDLASQRLDEAETSLAPFPNVAFDEQGAAGSAAEAGLSAPKTYCRAAPYPLQARFQSRLASAAMISTAYG